MCLSTLSLIHIFAYKSIPLWSYSGSFCYFLCALWGQKLTLHLFIRCQFSQRVWYAVFPYFSFFQQGDKGFEGFESDLALHPLVTLKYEKLMYFLRQSTWLGFCFFPLIIPNWDSMIQRVKSLSWRWFLARSRGPHCL